ncbi:MAG: transcription antitermination factor NusB [Clostridiales bacterium]|nr:transcription antitermination factor NusB [Clostridiales bacterium]
MTRKNARELSLHLLFELDFNTEDDIEAQIRSELSADRFNTLRKELDIYDALPDEKQNEYIMALTTGIIAQYIELNAYIEQYSVGWKLNRISRVCRCILRIAMYEMLYMDDITSAVSINEAVELTKKYDSVEASGFVNGILGSFERRDLDKKV